ncbi:MAG: putative bifunctional diguanylate cyclase/phosphodiesterase, partial [Candidatus Limnocylindria bacterium]
MQEALNVLLVEADPAMSTRVRERLEAEGLRAALRRVERPDSLAAALGEARWDFVLAGDGIAALPLSEVLRAVHLRDPDLPVLVLATTPGEAAAVAAIKAGASDYILQGDLARLPGSILSELEQARGRRTARRAEARLEHLAMHDVLTELPNRRLFEDRLANALRIASRDRHGLALMVTDLNGFKPVNDTFGHQAGDVLLRLVGGKLREALRESDTVARLGGDEFAVLVPKLEDPGVIPPKLLERLAGAFERPFRIEGVDVRVGAALGIAVYPQHGTDAATLFRNADSAMYTAKRQKYGPVIFDAAQDQYGRDRMALLDDLRQAIERGQLVLHYQPVVELRTGRVRDVEALVRWQHPERGTISPGEFLPMLDRLRLMRPLSEWVIETALRQVCAWSEAGIELDVTANVAAQNLADAEIGTVVRAAIARSGAPPERLFLEVPETVIMTDPERSARIIDDLKASGVRFAIDDFGTGFSSLTYLDRLRVDRLKVDRSFVSGTVSARKTAIVRAAAEIGHTLGFAVLAEGIEDAVGCERVSRQGCELGQGYHFAPPMPAERLAEWLRDRPRGGCAHRSPLRATLTRLR